MYKTNEKCLSISTKLHDAIKRVAAAEGRSMREVLTRMYNEYVEKRYEVDL